MLLKINFRTKEYVGFREIAFNTNLDISYYVTNYFINNTIHRYTLDFTSMTKQNFKDFIIDFAKNPICWGVSDWAYPGRKYIINYSMRNGYSLLFINFKIRYQICYRTNITLSKNMKFESVYKLIWNLIWILILVKHY